MQLYVCKALNKDGNVVEKKIFADENFNLFEKFKKSDLVLISKSLSRYSIRNPISDFTLPFFKSLAQLVRNKLNLIDALQITVSVFQNEEAQLIIETITEQIKAGMSFSKTLAGFSRYFDSLTIKTIEISEKTAELSESLLRIIDHLETSVGLRNKLKESIRYPLILLGFISFVFFFWLFVLVPKFAELFFEINIQPPLISRIIIKFSKFMSSNVWFVLTALAASFFILLKYFYSSKKVISRIPIISRMQREMRVYNFFTEMEIMLYSKINLIDALECMCESLPQISCAIDSIRSGNNLTASLSRAEIFKDCELAIIKSGESSGDLWPAFKSASDVAKQNIEMMSRRIISIMQPVAISFMGILLIVIVYALISPLYSNLDFGM